MNGWILYYRSEKDLIGLDLAIVKLLDSAKSKNINLDVYVPNDLEIISSAQGSGIFYQGKELELPDFVLPCMGAKMDFFARSVLMQLESKNVLSFNNSNSIIACGNKFLAHQLMLQNNVPYPKTMLLKFPFDIDFIKQHFSFPLILKHNQSMAGCAVLMCKDESELRDMLNFAHFNSSSINDLVLQRKIPTDLLLQQSVPDSYGKDLRVLVIGGRAIGCMKRVSQTSFKANFSQGGEVENFELTPQISKLAEQVAKIFNLDIAGVDLLFDGDSYLVCEVNSSPGFKGFMKATGIDVADLFLEYIFEKISK